MRLLKRLLQNPQLVSQKTVSFGRARLKQMALPLLLCLCALASGTERFPEPDFDSGYSVPEAVNPAARPTIAEFMDVAVLFLALGLAAYFVLKLRSRKAIFALTLFSLAYFGFGRQGCICPIGAIQNVTLALADTTYPIPLTVVAFFMLPLIFALLFGRVFCAAVCPLGAIQELVALRPLKLPGWLEHALGMLPYGYLAIAILFASTDTAFLICRFDPFVSFFRLGGNATMLAFGACFLLLGVFVARPYCRFLCPYSVLLRWLSWLSIWHATITPDKCIQCKLCEDSCPVGAIRTPTSTENAEPRKVGVRRLAILLLILPVMIGGGAWLGSLVAPALSRANHTVRLAEQVQLENLGRTAKTTMASEAFRGTGQSTAKLNEKAETLRKAFLRGGWVLGAFLGLVFGCKLISLSIRRKRLDYTPDRGKCISCGRCFAYCPREHLRRKNKKSQSDNAAGIIPAENLD